MSVLFVLIGASIIVALGFLLAFIWSVKTGQYEDDYTPSVRMLFDNEPGVPKKNVENKSTINK
ncbi:MAG: cbb3-type cytochrome oxidase assembly protein CcoS [Bacteroidota bacterium]